MKSAQHIIVSCLLFVTAPLALATTPYALTSAYFSRIKNNAGQQSALRQFISEMPKGGELHTHYSGSIATDDLIAASIARNYCVKTGSNIVSDMPSLNCLSITSQNKMAVKDSWSMFDFPFSKQSGHNHFFAIFPKLSLITKVEPGRLFAKIVQQNAKQHLLYMESMLSIDHLYPSRSHGNTSDDLARRVTWTTNKDQFYHRLLKQGLDRVVKQANKNINHMQAVKNHIAPQITTRYLYEILRVTDKPLFFTQAALAFKTASQNRLVVGINIVGPEDSAKAIENYHWQMEIVNYLHHKFPRVHIALHAGELTSKFAPSNALQNHIYDAIMTGDAERIGHGVDIRHEKNNQTTLAIMAKRHIPIEINLSSNQEILGVGAEQHPIMTYYSAGVPITLSTDDQGILDTDINQEYYLAASRYPFSYRDLKQFAGNSLRYSFLPRHLKAKLQRRLTRAFNRFERRIAQQVSLH